MEKHGVGGRVTRGTIKGGRVLYCGKADVACSEIRENLQVMVQAHSYGHHELEPKSGEGGSKDLYIQTAGQTFRMGEKTHDEGEGSKIQSRPSQ